MPNIDQFEYYRVQNNYVPMQFNPLPPLDAFTTTNTTYLDDIVFFDSEAMNPDFSILLPSLRPELCQRVIYEFNKTNAHINYEIIVVSPFEIKAEKVKWLKDQNLGSVAATNAALLSSTGKNIIYWSDDVLPLNCCLEYMQEYINMSYRQSSKTRLFAFNMMTPNKTRIGPFGAYGKLYACYGCISRIDLPYTNFLFYCLFNHSWGDIDLSMKIWDLGYEVELVDNACIEPHQVEDEIYKKHRRETWDADVKLFLDRWHSKYGGNLPASHEAVNKKLK